ncbi:MAG TPA: hypothetical protein VLT47_07310, partial [Anaeromyxobacteraceae bacterium]|nr:hypothetical protein [Anaeromyxobacteraceae bacterium]
MTPDDARLVALLAVFARERAPALVALLSHAEAAGLPEGVARAAAGSRGERLAALEAALGAGGDPTSRSEVLEALLSAERPARAADLRAL